jgi:lipoprotein-releasing system permease protein
LLQNNSIIIGKGLADKMLLTTGDIIKVTSAKGNLGSLNIVGISQIGIAEYDNSMSYTSLATAQKLLGQSKNYVTDIQVKLFDVKSNRKLTIRNRQYRTKHYFVCGWCGFVNCSRFWDL